MRSECHASIVRLRAYYRPILISGETRHSSKGFHSVVSIFFYENSYYCLSSKGQKEEISMRGSRAKKAKTIEEGTLMVVVDIGMVSHHVCCSAADGKKGRISTRATKQL